MQHVRQPVRFADAIAALDGVTSFIELGPDGVLSAMVDGAVPMLRRDRDEVTTALTALATLHVQGVEVDWAPLFAGVRPADLPTYAFQRQRFWPGTNTKARGDDGFWAAVDDGSLADRLGLPAAALADVLPALTSWRARSRERDAIDGWRYRITWKPATVPARPALPGTWILVGTDRYGLAATLTGLGATVQTGTPADLAELLAGELVSGILATPGSAAEALPLVQAVTRLTTLAPLWLVTRGAVATGRADAVVDPETAAVWGLGRVAGLEHPDRWGGLLDLPETLDARAVGRLAAVLGGELGAEDQIALRSAGVLLRRLTHAPATTHAAWRPRGTVLIAGGTGGLGAEVARWAAANGAERLILVSRRGAAAPGAADLMAELQAELPAAETRTGDRAAVEVHACDLADRAAVEALLAATGPVHAVVHAAGIVEDVALADADPAHLDRVLRGKVDGAQHLDDLAGDVDAFVVFSSIAATWGSGRQAAYGAANAALDALIQRRRAAGRPGTSIAWGPWARVGMAADAQAAAALRRQGLVALDPAPAIAALAQAVGAGDDLITVADVRWDEFLPLFTATRARPLLADLPEAATAVPAPATGSALAARLAPLAPAERHRTVLELVRAEVAAALGHASPADIAPDRAFKDLGFDSLTAVELRNRLQATAGLTLPATLAFDHPDTERLAAFVLDQVAGAGAAVPTTITAAAVTDDPIVIVGMGLRMPGGADTPQALWDLVATGADAIGEFPADRGWDLDRLYHPDPDHAGTFYAREGGFLPEAGDFDAGLFGISPREALSMDPQQRLLLETSWEAFEAAGVNPLGLRGEQVGVFVGATFMGYGSDSADGLEGHLLTGTASSVISGRISYTFGLEGPAVTVDTACSSSLVALHLATQALRSGECSMALVGGVTVMPTADVFVEFSRQRGLAPDGRCKSFGAGADGTGWSEGAGMLLVERLSAARASGHHVLAVVRGTAVNQDGASNGLTAPNGPAQQRVIRQALANAGLSAADVDVVEAHGTGTTLGDPIEAQALLATYGQDRADGPLWLGSVKSNIGHTQAAAGVAGIAKMVMAMRHGLLPATLHSGERSPHVDWSAGDVELLTAPQPWAAGDRPRRAGVSAFGVSGTNAHVILEEPPVDVAVLDAPLILPVVPVLVSGHTPEALEAQTSRMPLDTDLLPVGAAAARRPALTHRAVVLAADPGALTAGLDAIVAGTAPLTGTARPGRLGFLFTGQGAQRPGMGRGLYATFPVFADAYDAVAVHLDIDESALDETGNAQPALFALEVALAALLRSWGVVPDVLVGHSIGEIAAAHVAGVLSLEDAAALVSARGRLMQALPAGGVMLAVQASEDEVRAAFPDVDIAAVNGPRAVVVSGLEADISPIGQQGWKTTRLRTSHAFHSRLMDPMLDEFRAVVTTLTFTGTGDWADPEYWVQHVRRPVRFADAIAALDGVTSFIELGPDGVLSAMVDGAVPMLRRDRDEVTTALTALATLHVRGVPVDWTPLFAGVRPADLPTYAFQRERYWLRSAPTATTDPAEAGLWDTVDRGDLTTFAAELGVDPGSSLDSVLPALASWRARGRDRTRSDRWRYRITWQAAPEPAPAALAGTWVLAGADPAGLDAVLTGHGATVLRLPSGTRDDLAAQLRTLEKPIAGVLATGGPLDESLALVQALGDTSITAPLWLVTRGAVAVGRSDAHVRPEHALTWGFGRSVALERPESWGGLLDLPAELDRRSAARVAAVLAGAYGAEDQIAVRGSGVHVRRLGPAPAPRGAAWRPRGTVLIAGGTGGLGAEVARWAAANGAERLILVSRRGAGAPGAADLLTELQAVLPAADAHASDHANRAAAEARPVDRADRAAVEVHACDLADRAAVEALLKAVGSVNVVVHAAGVSEEVALTDADPAHLDRVVRGKVDGALHLDELAGDVDAFVVFSSISGVWGSGRQAAYGAANAALDALIARRRAAGRPGTAVAWGPWARVGMAAAEETAGQLRRHGLTPLDPARALAVLASAVGAGEDQVTVADVRWDDFLPLFTASRARPLFALLPEATPAAAPAPTSGLAARLAGLTPADRQRTVLDLVRADVAAVLGHAGAGSVAPDRAFKDLGFDSLTAVELRNRLRTATGVALPATLAFDHPSAERLAAFVLAEVTGVADAPEIHVPATAAADDDPIVIVGMGLRLPGGVESPEQYWDLLAGGAEGIGAFPTDRGWDLDRLYHPDPDHPGTFYAQQAGFLSGAGDFDAGLFGISPREATAMDPQQRLLLETSWEALERAGVDPRGLAGQPVGVYVGAAFMGYGTDSADGLEGHLLTGTASSVISGRISYAFGLEGPAVTVDTACSSSLVALHLAAQALRSGECSMALVGGVTVMPTPDIFVEFSRQRGLAADGRCKSFGAGADGTGWSEGAGMLLVERLSTARAAGHAVLAVVRGTAVNQDGASNGLTAPNGPAQQRVIRQALANAGLTTAEVDAVEAHGTGTTLGDPIEAQALLATYGQDRVDGPLWLGSVKSNIGHTQAAAGVAGIAKMILAMRHQTLPATLHAADRSPHIDWSTGDVALLTEAQPWAAGDRPRRAGVSAFGVSGTNAHVILEEPPAPPQEKTEALTLPVVPVLVSGHTPEALEAQTARLPLDANLPTVGAAMARRAALPHRAVILGDTTIRGVAQTGRLAFLFTGQGAQRPGMGKGLYETFPAFADAYDVVAVHLDIDESALDETGNAQPALFALEVALAALLRSWGVVPDVLVGHSIGEIAAAHVAGVLSLEDAATLVSARGRLMQALPAGGVMLAVQASEDEVRAAFPDVDIAAVNGPRAVVVSGIEADISPVEQQGWKTTRLRTSHAFHSRLMDPMLDDFRAVVTTLTFTGTGDWADPEYWVQHVRRPVRFADAIAALDGVTSFIELGPDGVLSAMVDGAVPMLRRDRDEVTTALTALAILHVQGVPVDWTPLFAGVRPADLPTYAFQRQRYWLELRPPVVDAGFWTAVDDGSLADRLGLPADALADVLPALTSWRDRSRDRDTIDGWRYRVTWEPAQARTTPLTGTWVVVADTPLAALLEQHGATVRTLPAGTRTDLAAALRASAPTGIVAAPGSLADALTIAQATADAATGARLWLLTRHAVTTGRSDGPPDVHQAAIWGLGRAVALELPESWGGLLDLPAALDARAAGRVVTVLSGGLGAEDQIAVRESGVFLRRLTAAPAAGGTTWHPRGTVLIAGGTGGLGAQVARWAAANGAERLILVSRRGATAPGTADLLTDLPLAEAHACDLADRAAVATLLAAVGPVDAIVHAAGVSEDVALTDADAAHLHRVVDGKVDGALHLDELAGDVDAFIVFSSISGVWGSAQQTAYGAANAALDALIARRRAAGRPGTAVAWGPWAEAGMAADAAVAAQLRRRGLTPMAPGRALAALALAVGSGDEQVTVADVRWDEFLPLFTASRARPFFDRLPEAAALTATPTTDTGLAGSLAALPAADRHRHVLNLVRAEVATVLGHTSPTAVEPARAFKELGFDSLTAVELRNRLRTATGLTLPATMAFDHPDTERLAAFVLDQITGADAPAAATIGATAADDDPIVIVGLGVRLPGGVRTPEQYWDLVAGGRDGIGAFPADRGWDLDALYHPDPEHPGTSYTRHGGFLDSAAEFDAGLFGISPREATAMDPQQRLLLETSWEAFESAAVDPLGLRGEQVGVFVGASFMGYGGGPGEAADGLEGHMLTGTASSVMSGRISYAFGLEGPAVTIDTACSSSLVALHLAAQALRSGECSMALVGGVTVMPNADVFVEFSRQRGLAPDGRCKSFGAAADGTGWSEGAGMLLVERLSAARASGHHVLAVVRGTAVNQDGASNGLTAPNGPAQQRVIRQALANAGLSAADVDVVEAHGTGTTLGDPIEAQALLATYGQDRADGPLWLGSVKSNIGHTQAAAGVAGIAKMVLAMRHELLPATLHAEEISPHVDWSTGDVELLTQAQPWAAGDRPRRAGVSAFGVSGTNAHVILEEAPPAPRQPAATPLPLIPVPVSGNTAAALHAQARQWATTPAAGLRALAAAAAHRPALTHRAVVLAADPDALTAGLDAIVAGTAPLTGTARPGRLGFLFTGQGAQRPGMGRGLYEAFPVFADAYDAVAVHLDIDETALDETGNAQPALFALEVALAALLRSWGVVPDVLVGHSIGEIAAAHVSGVLSLDDAATLVSARGRLMQALPAGGVMLAVQASEEAVRAAFPDVDIAAVNGPRAVVVSGVEADISPIEGQGWKTTRLRTSHAFHSRLMDPMLDEFRAVVRGLTFHEPAVAVVSSVDPHARWTDPEYWVRQVREPVRFADAVAALPDVTSFVEVGPDAVLTALAENAVPMLRRDRDEVTTALTALATLYVRGVPVDWTALHPGVRPAPLPTYAFQRQRFWINPGRGTGDLGAAGLTDAGHPLLGAVVPVADGSGVLLTGRLSLRTHAWLGDHVVNGVVLLPGTALLELAVQAAHRAGCDTVEELTLHAPLVIPASGAVQLQVRVGEPGELGRRDVHVHSRTDGEHGDWQHHAGGSVLPAGAPAAGAPDSWPPAGAVPVPLDGCYAGLSELGLDYGPAFQALREVWRSGDELFAEVALDDEQQRTAPRFAAHPALIDAALHALSLTGGTGDTSARLPFSWSDVTVHATGADRLRVRLTLAGDAVRLAAFTSAGEPVLTAGSLVLRPVPSARPGAADLYAVRWTPLPAPAPAGTDGWTVLGTALPELPTLPAGDMLGAPVVVVPAGGTAEQTTEEVRRILGILQRALATDSRLVVLTRDAMLPRTAIGDLAGAAVWGLLRSAQQENPGRFVLADLDDDPASWRLLTAAAATGEPQLAIRAGVLLAPRLARAVPDAPAPETPGTGLFGTGTVLVTGGSGALAGRVARHLASAHGVRHLLLLSRSGGGTALAEQLRATGTHVTLAAADVADRDALAAVLAGIPDAHPLTAVVHTAGVLADGIAETMTADQLDRVLRPKVDGARHLHELTSDRDLAAFVLFSSASALFGTPGQANYAAANAFLDALARHRRDLGLPGHALAWGPWADGGMAGELSENDRQRMARAGVLAFDEQDGLAAFDAALAVPAAEVVPIRLDLAAVQAGGDVPPLLGALVRRTPVRVLPSAEAAPIGGRLAALAPADQLGMLLDLVHGHVATVLGHADASAIEPTRGFLDLGFDSLTAVELRNGLTAATGLRLPATVIFDYPAPADLAAHLRDQLAPAAPPLPALAELDRLETALGADGLDPQVRDQIAVRLRKLLAAWQPVDAVAGQLDEASDDEMFAFIDNELGL
ncbi:type I polyketide synthase [Actinoplanes palleronii]|uniref:type I polyketide synthase n=1 Tax=Actinoplanes palleronii TaxID=113570 RepID=UPI001945021F|nr:type I polyketide synthase [Actinoplanes palleronii]